MPDPILNIAASSHFALSNSHNPKPTVAVTPTKRTHNGDTPLDHGKHSQPNLFNHPEKKLDASVLTGPPPAFEASLLELERDIEIALKRMEARRSQNIQAVSVRGKEASKMTSAAHNEDAQSDGRTDQTSDAPDTLPKALDRPQEPA